MKKSKKNDKDKITKAGFALRLLLHSVIIGLMVVLGAIFIHFTLLLTTRHNAHRTVPQFELLSLEEAMTMAVEHNLRLIVSDSLYAPSYERGAVIDQLPKSGSVVKPGRSIYVTINATQQQMVEIPYVAERSLRQGKSLLEGVGLTVDRLIYIPDLATNYILHQQYKNDTINKDRVVKAPIGSGVTLYVGLGNGNGESVVPQLVGRSLHSAKSAILDAGFNVGRLIRGDSIDTSNERLSLVLRQSIPADSTLRLGSEISLELTLYPSKLDSLLKAEDQQRKMEELMERLGEEEQAVTDSLMRILAPEEALPEEPKVKREKVRFEDLFN